MMYNDEKWGKIVELCQQILNDSDIINTSSKDILVFYVCA